MKIIELDKLFASYNYRLAESSNNDVRVYTLRYGMYHAAEIVLINDGVDVSQIKSEYSDLGYATEIQKLSSGKNLEEYLFEGFFIKTPLGNELKGRYNQFVKRQIQNLPDDSEYRYINCAYEKWVQNPKGTLVSNNAFKGDEDESIISDIENLLNTTNGALIVIIEAAAGFGKTCTAYELLKSYSNEGNKKLPFFTELSRNREARVFKHILLNEIDEQFPTGIKQNIVIDQIGKGRIPLIIDGFDELISKDNNKEEVESMLTTIIDLLKEEAKIIITSRKTAIFNSDEFLEMIHDNENDFSLARFEIKEPTISNWLSEERLSIINKNNFPISTIANPVLLAYLRNISMEKLSEYFDCDSNQTIVETYIEYLLAREQSRQNIKLTNQDQLRIFRKLVRFMTEFDFTAESKDTIKEIIKDYNLKILSKSLSDYVADERPSIDDLVDTLSNHVFLDRKANGLTGFVNDFIFGLLIGDNLVQNKFQEYYHDFYKIIPQDFSDKCVQVYKIHDNYKQMELWNIFNSHPFNYTSEFYFEIDLSFKHQFVRDYNELMITDRTFNEIVFTSENSFINCLFSSVTFNNCKFNIAIWHGCTFQNCNFYDCEIISNEIENSFNDFALFACNDNNNFISTASNKLKSDVQESNEEIPLTDDMVLKHFFGVGGQKPRARKLSYIKKSLTEFSDREISKVVNSLKSQQCLYFKDDIGFITKNGIQYLNQLNKNSNV